MYLHVWICMWVHVPEEEATGIRPFGTGSRKRDTLGMAWSLLKCRSPSLVTHLLQQGHTPNPSQTCIPTETKSSNMKPIGTTLLKTATKNIPLCIFPFNYILNCSFFPSFPLGRNCIFLSSALHCLLLIIFSFPPNSLIFYLVFFS